MKRSAIGIIISLLSAGAVLCSCETIVVPDENVRYEYLFDCLWTPDDHSPLQTDTPQLFIDHGKPVYFTHGGKFVILEESEGGYGYADDLSFAIDDAADKMTVSTDDGSYYFIIDRICETHMTLFHDGNDTGYVTYRRSEFPEPDLIDESSFPDGWFE